MTLRMMTRILKALLNRLMKTMLVILLLHKQPEGVSQIIWGTLNGTKPQDTIFFVGQAFENAEQLKKALADYCIHHGKNVSYTKNHKDRVGAVCKVDGCPWRIWASWDGNKKSFAVKTHLGEHTCGWSCKVNKISSTWIANHYQKKFKINPYLKLMELMDSVWLDWGIKVSKFMAFKARRKGQALIVGEYKEQFALLPRYGAEIRRSNPNNTIKFQLSNNVFERMYLCFDALRRGFLDGCRPFISLDGCFLKAPYGGQLLVAVGRDGNNQMFPIAWAVVEVESKDSWG
ncbi:uncharacterized protein LOC125492672 [Beta vulgaris subsp. vulgaris]|uniref:uncharacterized protein LOC125492672 n=1 Tax=Beta vulgaris subsp. vulgaris TaxID=3555 RepID=UPI0020376700|nr:uncharacterized protein LOC125492672 [Beta vulgaris subsp. vulgaris]